MNNAAKFYKSDGKVCEDSDKSLLKPPQKFVTTPKLAQEIAAEVILTAEVMTSSNACLTLITNFVPYRWNAAENYKCFSLRNYKSESHSHKGCPNKEARKPKCANCKGRLKKGVLNTKSRITYGEQAKILCRSRRPKALTQPKSPQTFQFIAEPLTKFVSNVVIQIAQPQVCYPNPKQDMLDLKSSMC